MRSSVPILLGLLVSACRWDELGNDTRATTGGAASDTGGASSGFGAPGGGAHANGGGLSATSGGDLPAISGCGVNAPSGVQNRTLAVRGMTRSFVLSVPEDYDSARSYALVFAWHGQAGDGALARRYFGVEEAAAGKALFVYPDGLPLSDADGDTAWDLSPDGADMALFDALLAQVYSEYCINASRIFSTGHSYGAYMTNRLGCNRSKVLRGVAPVAGGPPFGRGHNVACVGQIAALLVHGADDTDVDLSEGEAARDRYLKANACSLTTQPVMPAPCVSYDGCAPYHPVLWCQHQGNHDWPDFAGPGIWAFFKSLE